MLAWNVDIKRYTHSMIGVFLRTDNCLRGSYEHLSAKWLLCGQGRIQNCGKKVLKRCVYACMRTTPPSLNKIWESPQGPLHPLDPYVVHPCILCILPCPVFKPWPYWPVHFFKFSLEKYPEHLFQYILERMCIPLVLLVYPCISARGF